MGSRWRQCLKVSLQIAKSIEMNELAHVNELEMFMLTNTLPTAAADVLKCNRLAQTNFKFFSQ